MHMHKWMPSSRHNMMNDNMQMFIFFLSRIDVILGLILKVLMNFIDSNKCQQFSTYFSISFHFFLLHIFQNPSEIPKTNFQCKGRPAGYYADIEAGEFQPKDLLVFCFLFFVFFFQINAWIFDGAHINCIANFLILFLFLFVSKSTTSTNFSTLFALLATRIERRHRLSGKFESEHNFR